MKAISTNNNLNHNDVFSAEQDEDIFFGETYFAPKMRLDASFEESCARRNIFDESSCGLNTNPCFSFGNNWEGLILPKTLAFEVALHDQDTEASSTHSSSHHSEDFLNITPEEILKEEEVKVEEVEVVKVKKAIAKPSASTRKNLPKKRRRRRKRVKKPKVLADYKPIETKKLTLREKIAKKFGNKTTYEDEDIQTILPELKSKVSTTTLNTQRKSNFSTMFSSEKFYKNSPQNVESPCSGLLSCVQESILTYSDSISVLSNETSSPDYSTLTSSLNRTKNMTATSCSVFSQMSTIIRELRTKTRSMKHNNNRAY